MIKELNETKFFFNEEKKSIDVSMIPFTEIMAVGNEMGYKIWVLAEPYGYLVQFEIYQDTKRRKLVASSTKWGLREYVVLRPIKC